MKKHFSVEEKDDLLELVTHPGFKTLLKLLDSECEAIEADVLKLSLEHSDDRTLLLKKARAEGARLLSRALATRLGALKTKP